MSKQLDQAVAFSVESPGGKTGSVFRKVMGYKIGIFPLGVFVPFFIVTSLLLASKDLPKDMLGAMAIMIMYGFVAAELGKRIPVIKSIGGTVIMATFLPSFMAAHKLIPNQAVETVTTFMKSTNFLYVFISMIVVGSILSMNREVLVKAFMKMFVPLLAGSIAGTAVGISVGSMLGIGPWKTFFFIVVPIMAGGVGEGAVPLSIAYSAILKTSQEATFAEVLPVVMLGSLSAIILSSLLRRLGEWKPQYSGNGSLLKTGDAEILKHANTQEERSLDLSQMAVGAVVALGLYLFGQYVYNLLGLPATIVMLLTAVLLKLFRIVPKNIEDGGYAVYRFTVMAVTYPLLLGVGVAMTPWKNIAAILTNPAYLLTIFMTVLSMVVVGFFVGKKMNMNPIEAAIVTACHSGQGGTGDVAILTASNRLILMPFAQVSTRIGGAATVTLAVILLRWFS